MTYSYHMTTPQFVKRLLPIVLVALGIGVLIYLVTWQPATTTKSYTTYVVTKKDVQHTIQETGVVITRHIDNEDKKVVQWYVDEDQVNNVSNDQVVTLEIDALDEAVEGKIESITDSPRITGDATAYEVIVTLNKEPERLFNGMHADVTVVVEAKTNVLAVPNNSLTKTDDTYSVIVVHEQRRIYLKRLGIDTTEQTVETKIVEIGLAGDDFTEITSGLNAGDSIATN